MALGDVQGRTEGRSGEAAMLICEGGRSSGTPRRWRLVLRRKGLHLWGGAEVGAGCMGE